MSNGTKRKKQLQLLRTMAAMPGERNEENTDTRHRTKLGAGWDTEAHKNDRRERRERVADRKRIQKKKKKK